MVRAQQAGVDLAVEGSANEVCTAFDEQLCASPAQVKHLFFDE